MRQRTSGFASIILLGIAALALAGAIWYTSQHQSQNLGASVQTQLSDTIGTFRTNVNTNFTNIDASIASITSTQAAYGTIISQNTPLGAAVGGTGTTTLPSANQILSANGTNPAWKTLSVGAGLNVTNTGSAIQIGTAGFDNTASISFTGNNTHAGTETFNGQTTLASTTSISGTSTVSGVMTFTSSPIGINKLLAASASDTRVFSTAATTTVLTATFNSSTIAFAKTQGVTGRVYFDSWAGNAFTDRVTISLLLNNIEVASTTATAGTSNPGVGYVDFTLINGSSTNVYNGNLAMTFTTPFNNANTFLNPLNYCSSTYSQNSVTFAATSTLTVSVTVRPSGSDSNIGLRARTGYMNYITQ